MRMKTTKRRCILADANIVIKAHELGVWEPLCRAFRIAVPSTVVGEAYKYHLPGHEQEFEIDLVKLGERGEVERCEATVQQIASVLEHFDPVFRQRMDPGEAETLAVLIARPNEELLFCTADGPAIRAIAMLDMSHRSISFETALRQRGLSRWVPRQLSESFFRSQLEKGKQNRITGEGLSPDSPFRL